ncbi:hypothetical protein BDQ12DRAFT_693188 [Crucibulum laeve]|uniref:Uncharacterized protein n=1 Tax=Crucibulum laeve TaxID=68775 RepID=A0A5C3LFV9_9AGAR|nr:hypothetical protein BDQ12DRAFT_693188 [Crucibulum laeve]
MMRSSRCPWFSRPIPYRLHPHLWRRLLPVPSLFHFCSPSPSGNPRSSKQFLPRPIARQHTQLLLACRSSMNAEICSAAFLPKHPSRNTSARNRTYRHRRRAPRPGRGTRQLESRTSTCQIYPSSWREIYRLWRAGIKLIDFR